MVFTQNFCAQCFMPIKRIFGVHKVQKFLMLKNLIWKEKQLNKIKYLLCKFYKHARRTKLPQFATSLRVLFTQQQKKLSIIVVKFHIKMDKNSYKSLIKTQQPVTSVSYINCIFSYSAFIFFSYLSLLVSFPLSLS